MYKITKLLGVGALALIVLTGCTPAAPLTLIDSQCGDAGSLEGYCDVATATPTPLPTIAPVSGAGGSLTEPTPATLQIADISGSAGSLAESGAETFGGN